MDKVFRTFGHTVKKLSLWVLALLLATVLILQIAVLAGVNWLQSENGQAWLQGQLNNVMAQTGMALSFDHFSYSFPQAITVQDVSLRDRQGHLVAEIDKARIGIDVLPLAARTLSLSLKAGTVFVHRLPAESGKEEAADDKPASFTMPDLYFESFAPDITIRTLAIDKDVFGLPLELSPHTEGRISLADGISFNLQLTDQGESAPAWFPDESLAAGRFDPQTFTLSLERYKAVNAAYDLEGSGTLALTQQPAADLAFKGRITNLQPLTGIKGNTSLNGNIQGALTSPALTLNGKAELPLIKAYGLGILTYQLETANMADPFTGTFDLQSTYSNMESGLAGHYDYKAPVISLSALEGSGPHLALGGAIDINTATLLADGTLAMDVASLRPYGVLVSADLGGSGKIEVSLSAPLGQQAASIHAALDQPRYNDITAARLEGAVTYDSFSSLWPQALSGDVKNLQMGNSALFSSLAASLDKQEGAYRLSLKGQGGALKKLTMQGSALISGLEKEGLPEFSGIDIGLRSGNSRFDIAGSVTRAKADLDLRADNFALADLPAPVPDMFSKLRASGTGRISGPPDSPQGDFALAFTPLALNDSAASLNLSVQGNYQKNALALSVSGSGNAVDNLSATLSVPLEFSLLPARLDIPDQAPLAGQAAFNMEGAALSDLFLPRSQTVRGRIEGRADIGGTLADPAVDGTLSMREGSYRFIGYGVNIEDITMEAGFTGTQITVKSLTASDGNSGTLRTSGHLDLQDPQATDLDLAMQDFHLFQSGRLDGTLSADLSLRGRDEGYLARGDVNIDQIDFTIPGHFQTSIPELNIVETGTGNSDESAVFDNVTLDIGIHADNRVFIRGWGLDAEFAGDIRLTGTLEDPQLNGTLEAVRGRYEEFGRRFDLDRAEIRFRGRIPPSPYINVDATTALEDITATVKLSGRLTKPSIGFSSDPSLPEDEIMSHILFGRDIGQITPFQALKLKQTLDRLTGRGGGGFDPLQELQSVTGLDEISVDTAGGETTLGVGKYLSDDVYLELEKGQAEGSGAANLEVELSPHISLESTVGQNDHSGAGVFWEWDY